MASKRASLGLDISNLRAAAQPQLDPVASVLQPEAPKSPPETPVAGAPSEKSSARQRSRAGKVGIQFWAEPDTRKRLKRLALDSDRTLDDLMREAVEELLSKHGC